MTIPLPSPRQRLPVQGEPPAIHHGAFAASLGPGLTMRWPVWCPQLLLIGDSGVGKSCLLLRFAVRLPMKARAAGGKPEASSAERGTSG